MGVGVDLNGGWPELKWPTRPYLSKAQCLSCCVVRGFSNANGHWGEIKKSHPEIYAGFLYTFGASHERVGKFEVKTGLKHFGLVCSWKEAMRVEVRNFKAFPLTWVSHGFNRWLTNPLKSAINVTLGWGVSPTLSQLWISVLAEWYLLQIHFEYIRPAKMYHQNANEWR